MSLSAVFAIALALAMDAFAVSLTTGLCRGSVSAGQTLRMAGTFGLFQFLMPLAGWAIGSGAQRYIEAYDHWVAFALLAFVGGRMIREAWKGRHGEEQGCESPDPTRGLHLLMLGVATSIDALAVGLTLALLNDGILLPALIIGLVCFCLSAAGMHLGRLARFLPFVGGLGVKANAIGGVVLFAVALKILQEHGVFSSFSSAL